MTIPRIIHYCFGFAEDFGGKPWSLLHHVCVSSAIDKIKPEQVFFYYAYEPTGPWWDLTRALVTPVKIDVLPHIYGRPLKSAAHRADVVRLIALLEKGGIYLDCDVFVHRSFDMLLEQTVVLGEEGQDRQFGVANAVMLSMPHSLFLTRLLDQYKWFRGGADHTEPFWNEHSVQLPSFMTRLFPNEVTVLDYRAFYWPLWVDQHIDWIFKSDVPIDLSNTFANHLWESRSWSLVADLTTRDIRNSRSNFANWAKPYLEGLPDDYGLPGVGKDADTANRLESRQAIFRRTYAEQKWGRDGISAFFSGIGSRGEPADIYIEAMGRELADIRSRLGRPLTILDIGCGDFAISAALLEGSSDRYLGCDIVPELIVHNAATFGSEKIQFVALDAVEDALPDADVCLVRQVFQHLSNAEILAILPKLTKYAAVFVTAGAPLVEDGFVNPDKTTSDDVRFDWRTGVGRGIELDQAPFSLDVRLVCEAFLPKEKIRTFRIQ